MLAKTEDEMREYFNIMKGYDISAEDAMNYMSQCPKLLTVDI